MSPDRWQKAKEIFDRAVDLRPEARDNYLRTACGDDAELRREVENLLGSYESEFMEKPAVAEQNPNDGRLLAGSRLGRYEVIRTLGAGGMGEVYLANDPSLDRRVAIKVLNQKYERHESNIRRFIQEAKAASALNHPNILTIHEIGDTGGSHFIVSEFVEGTTLRDLLHKKGDLELAEVLEIATQTASALSAAHTARIIHRDIKPENIIVREDGYVKVLDFGLAKLLPEQPSFVGLEDQTVRQNQTAEGLILGTVSYMSPEQARGRTVDARTDIFSLGVLIFEMITGRTPFTGDSMSETFANLINKEPPPLARFASAVPDELERVVSKMLRKDPDERYQTMKGLLADLKELKDRTSIEAKLGRTSTAGNDNETAVMTRTTGDVPHTTAQTQTHARSWYRRPLALAIIPVILLAAAAIGWYWRSATTARPQIRSIAVLPLDNLSGDPSQEYFADGMTEALIGNLSQLKELKVISRTSVMRYKDSREALPDIARALGVDAVVEGSVQKSGDRVRVTAQLIHAASDTHMWARNYERDLSDVLKLQSDIAQAIVREIRVQLTPAEQTRLASSRTIDPKAHEAYLLGKFHSSKLNEEDISRSINYFQQAIRIQPDYADAYAGLAMAWSERGIWGKGKLADYEAQVRDAASTAIRIDPENANAHVAMCRLLTNYDHNWAEAEDEAKRAIEIDPNNAEALVVYSWLLQSLGRHDELRPMMEKAELLDPVSSDIQSAFGRMLYRARKYGEAERHLKRAIELDPTNYSAYGRLGDVYIEMGRFNDALAQLEKSAELQPQGAHAMRRAVIYARMGERKKALDTMAGISNRPWWELARLYTALGDTDRAFEVLREMVDKRESLFAHLKEDPSFVPLHSDPRWEELMRRLNF